MAMQSFARLAVPPLNLFCVVGFCGAVRRGRRRSRRWTPLAGQQARLPLET